MDPKIILTVIVAVLLLLLVGVPIIAELTSKATAAQIATNEGITCTNGTTVTLKNDNLVDTGVTLTNGTITVASGNYSVTASTGKIWFIQYNSTIFGTSCYVTYDYYDDSYQTNTVSRTVTGYILTFIALVGLVLVTKHFGLW